VIYASPDFRDQQRVASIIEDCCKRNMIQYPAKSVMNDIFFARLRSCRVWRNCTLQDLATSIRFSKTREIYRYFLVLYFVQNTYNNIIQWQKISNVEMLSTKEFRRMLYMHKCEICDQEFSNKKALKKHKQEVHSY
jgi:hypothetical protein